jgi:hypothetical protein
MDQNEMSNLYIGPSIDASYQVASEEKLFQKSTNKKQVLPMMAMFPLTNMAATGNSCF